MRKTFTLLAAVFGLSAMTFAQVGAQAQDFTVTDLDGNTHTLSDILNDGKVVVLDCSATWCPPCWSFHQAHYLQDLHDQYGPNGTDQIRVLFYEADPSTNLADLQGTGTNTQGDWLTGSTYPFIDETTLSLSGANYWPLGFPTINVIDLNGTIQADLYDPWAAGGGLPEFVDILDDYWQTSTANVEELSLTNATVYPNPSNGESTITFASDVAGDVNIEVINLVGQVVYTDIATANAGNNKVELNMTNVENGQYIVRLSNESMTTTANIQIRK